MFEGQGALATFSSRIDFAYLLGLIPKNAQRDLHLVRKIRNIFAYLSENLTFEKPELASRCRELYFDGAIEPVSPRSKFTRAMMGLIGLIHCKIRTVTHEVIEPDHNIEANQVGMRAFYDALSEKGFKDLFLNEFGN